MSVGGTCAAHRKPAPLLPRTGQRPTAEQPSKLHANPQPTFPPMNNLRKLPQATQRSLRSVCTGLLGLFAAPAVVRSVAVTVAAAAGMAAMVFRPLPTYAGLEVCNRTDEKIWTAYSYIKDVKAATLGAGFISNHKTRGWWGVSADGCVTLYSGGSDAAPPPYPTPPIYKYSKNWRDHKGGGRVWVHVNNYSGSGVHRCINKSKIFDIVGGPMSGFTELNPKGEGYYRGIVPYCEALGDGYGYAKFLQKTNLESYTHCVVDVYHSDMYFNCY